MNPLDDKLVTGAVGELLIQLRLLQFGVQAAPPIRDSGNDLIAIRGNVFRAIQVKSTRGDDVRCVAPDRAFHLLGLVRLEGEDNQLHLDKCDVFLVPKDEVAKVRSCYENGIERFRLTAALVEELFLFVP